MDTIEALRERANLAQRQLSDQGGQHLRLFERLGDRISAVADELRDKHETIAAYGERVDRLTGENDQLREILQSLLLAIESDANHGLSPAIRGLESKVCSMIGGDDAGDDGQADAITSELDNDETGQDLADDVIVMDADPAIETEDALDSEFESVIETAIEDESDDEISNSVATEADVADVADDADEAENDFDLPVVADVDAEFDRDMAVDADVDPLAEVADSSIINDALDDAAAASASTNGETSNTVSQLNAIGDIVQRLMKEMSDCDETAEDEEVDEADLKAS